MSQAHHRKFTGGKTSLGSEELTVDIYRAVKEAEDAKGVGLTVDEIHRRLDDPAFRSDTAAWWNTRPSFRPRGDEKRWSTDIREMGRERVKARVQYMREKRQLISDGAAVREGGVSRGGTIVSRYTTNPDMPPKGYRPKTVPNPIRPHGWYPIDVSAAERDAALHRDRVILLREARAELAKPRKRESPALRLLAEAVRLLEARS
jgi:hypothetical protein